MTLTVQQLVQPTASIVNVISLKKGDVYKRLDDSSYSGPKIKFGVVSDIMHNGEAAAITALEYEVDTSDAMKVELKVFAGDKAPALFAVDVDEFDSHLRELAKSVKTAIDKRQKEILELSAKATVINRLRRAHLTAPEQAPVLVIESPEKTSDELLSELI